MYLQLQLATASSQYIAAALEHLNKLEQLACFAVKYVLGLEVPACCTFYSTVLWAYPGRSAHNI
jgi:hypothetical protein